MFGSSQDLARLQTRKQALLVQSEVNRRLLIAEAPPLRAAAGWVDAGVQIARLAKPLWDLGSVLIGSWTRGRREKSSGSGVVARLARALRLWFALSALWKNWLHRDGTIEPPASERRESTPTVDSGR